jgi:hypothetical protein
MKEIKVVRYEADDGKVFDTKYECERYEAEIADRATLTTAFNTILDYCRSYSVEHYIDDNTYSCYSDKCPFNDGGLECSLCNGLLYREFNKL